jgi:uncharacterized protein (TIGR03437 family)
MVRFAVSFLGFCLCVRGQFIGLATPADGSRVYFATMLRQKNTTQPVWGKLFQIDASGLQLVLSRDEQIPPPPPYPTQALVTNAFDIFAGSVSADAQVSAVAARRACPYGSCTYERVEIFATTISANGRSTDYPGALQLSASGEWAFGASANGVFGQAAYLFNVKTGEGGSLDAVIPFFDRPIRIASTGHSVADDGTFAYSTGQVVVTIHGQDVRRIPGNGNTQEPVMDRSGGTIVFAVGDTIRLADPTGSGSSLLLGNGFAPSLSDDGQTLVYLANRAKPQLHVFRLGGADRQLGFDTAGIAQAILSGDGSTIYAVTLGGRLLKVSAATGVAQELIPRTPYLTGGGPLLAPGKLTSLSGVGLTDLSFTADAPLPAMLNGIRVSIQGQTTLIQSVSPNAITVLVPPTVTPSSNGTVTSPIDVTLTSPSPFDGPHADMYIAQYAPDALTIPGTNTVLAAHQDWHGLVTTDDPAAPGEVIHAYAVGLGDTSPSVGYGQPAPTSEPLARLKIPISCADSNSTRNALEILYQGLAPGFAGVYQIDVRMPSDLPRGNFGLYCVWGGIGSGGPAFGGTIPMTGQ